MNRRIPLVIVLLSCPCFLLADDPAKGTPKEKNVAVRLVDEEGRPVAGAHVGTMAAFGKVYAEEAAKGGGEWLYVNHTRSDENGTATIEEADELLGHLCVVARHERRRISAAVSIDPSESMQPVVITLRPERTIAGETSCPELPEPRHSPRWLVVYVMKEGKKVLETQWEGRKFEFSLPPGDYKLWAYGRDTHDARPDLTVTPGAEVQRLMPITLRAKRIALLEGQPAPELMDVVAWKNSPPQSWGDLRGKCVLLEFWGYWCGPCVYRMPEVFALYDKYHAQGLEIVGVHVDLGEDEQQPVATVVELDERLKETRATLWQNRDLPFPVALVIGKRTLFGNGIEGQARSAASAAFGVTSYPTQVLIDRRGNIVGQFTPNDEGIKLLEQKLAEK